MHVEFYYCTHPSKVQSILVLQLQDSRKAHNYSKTMLLHNYVLMDPPPSRLLTTQHCHICKGCGLRDNDSTGVPLAGGKNPMFADCALIFVSEVI